MFNDRTKKTILTAGEAYMKRTVQLFALIVLVSAALGAQQKVIKDQSEYNAYIAALNTQDPVQKASAMEKFVDQYPHSIVKIDALEQAMAAYQQSGNAGMVEDSGKRILALEPNNIRALAMTTFLARSRAVQGDAAALATTIEDSKRGIAALSSWTKPEGTTDAEYKSMQDSMTRIFYGAAGFAALQAKDFTQARADYTKAVGAEPADMQDVYQLGIAELQMTPVDVNGFWYLAKAYHLSNGNTAAQDSISKYAKASYRRVHGGVDGWDQILASAEKQNVLPKDFSSLVTLAPTAAELAVEAVRENDPTTLSFSDMEFILHLRDASAENRAAADKVWQSIQDKEKGGAAKLQMNVKVVSASRSEIQAAITDENQEANRADMKIVLEQPATAPPARGVMITVTGVITEYQASPFLFTMSKAQFVPSLKPSASPK